MAIEFICPGCQSRHACADHMVGRQFKCGGCGKLLEVPATSAADAAPRRSASQDAGDGHVEERGMGAGLQLTLLVGGGIALAVFLLLCLGGGAMLFWVVDEPGMPGPVDPAPGPVAPAIEPIIGPEPAEAAPEAKPPPKK